jgi:hypothetical protein
MKSLTGKNFDSRFQDEMIFVIFNVFIDFSPLASKTHSNKL